MGAILNLKVRKRDKNDAENNKEHSDELVLVGGLSEAHVEGDSYGKRLEGEGS